MLTSPITNASALDIFTSLDPKAVALLFDVDGTLIDIGPSPFEVDVSDELLASLVRLYELTEGALALVSGRPIVDLDRLFRPLKLPMIGGHGAEMRLHDGNVFYSAGDLPDAMRGLLAEVATPESGIVAENKGYSVALHYRKAPKEAERLRKLIASVRAAFPQEATELLLGKAMFEVKRPGVDKGYSVRELMKRPPFAGRTPVFIGDDVTDESVFKVLPELRGISFSVRRHFPGLVGIFDSAEQVRSALKLLASRRPSERV